MEVDLIAYHHIAIAMNGENTEGDATAKANVELQELMRLTCEEMKVLKTSGVTCACKVLPQQPGTYIQNFLGYRLLWVLFM